MIWSRGLQFWGCISAPFMKRGARGDFLVPYLTKSPHPPYERAGDPGSARGSKPERTGGIGESALKLRARWEGDCREAEVRTGLGKAPGPGLQGGLRQRGPWWNEAPT